MSAENKATARRFYEEVLNKKNLALIDELVSSDFEDHNPPGPGMPRGPEGVRQVFTAFSTSFPDMQATIHDMVAEGDRVVSRFTFRGTHKGELMGLAATGKQVAVGIIDILRIEDGKLVECWGEADLLGMMQQVGIVPPPG